MLQLTDFAPVLLSTSPSSCEVSGPQSSLVITPPPIIMTSDSETSFDWSNFPLVQQHSVDVSSTPSCATPNKPMNQHLRRRSSLTMSSCSSSSDLSMDFSKNSNNSLKRVSFSEVIQVRTHNIVLGEHPCCAQLALELGWEHDGEGRKVDLNQHESAKSAFEVLTPTGHRRRLCIESHRLSYFERKALLKEVAGMTDEEIRQTTLRHAAPSRRNLNLMQKLSI